MSGQTKTRIIGHRGASGYRPEHTRAAYELAFRLGADAVEPDIISTRDGVLVIRHENEISTTTDVAERPEFADRRVTKEIDGKVMTGWFTEDFTWAELSTLRARERLSELRPLSASFDGSYPILRLRDLLAIVDESSEALGTAKGIVAEIKHASYFESIGLPLDELFADELASTGWWNNPSLVVESFERTVFSRLHARGYEGKRIYLVEVEGAPADRMASHGSSALPYSAEYSVDGMVSLASAPALERVEGISVETRLLLSDDGGGDAERVSRFVEDAHAGGLEAYCWTLRPENVFLPVAARRGERDGDPGAWRGVFDLLANAGFEAVFADHPDLAVAAIR